MAIRHTHNYNESFDNALIGILIARTSKWNQIYTSWSLLHADDDVGSISRDAVRQSSQYRRAGSQCISTLDTRYLRGGSRVLILICEI